MPRDPDYVGTTVDSLVAGIPEAAWDRVEVVLFDASPPSAQHGEAHAVAKRNGELVRQGRLTLIDNPDGYPRMDEDRDSLTDHMVWRCKLVLDFARLARFCAQRGDYYLHVEDDCLAAPHFLRELTTWFDGGYASRDDWVFLTLFRLDRIPDHQSIRPDQFGSACALLFRCDDVPRVADFCEERFREKPLDFLLGDFIREDGRSVYAKSPALFQHVGLFSSLAGQTHPLQALGFRESPLPALRRALGEGFTLIRRDPGAFVPFLRWRLAILVPAFHRFVRWILRRSP